MSENTEDKSKFNGKLSFGKYAVLGSVSHTLKSEPSWYWVIKPLTIETDIKIQQLLIANQRFIKTSEGEPLRVPPAEIEVALYQIAATFEETNIPDPSDPTKPFIDKGASMTEIIEKLKLMPYTLMREIWEAVIKQTLLRIRNN